MSPGNCFVIWPMAELIERNREAGQAGGPARQQLIAFGDDRTGNPFCAQQGHEAVYYWSAIDQEATRIANDLPTFWRAWVSGTLPLH